MSAQSSNENRILDFYGGKEQFYKFFATVKRQIDAIDDIQLKETEDTGRVLQAHLMIESLLSQYIQRTNPSLPLLRDSRLTFSQKLDLLNPLKSSIYFLVPGLRCLDDIRNRLVHDSSIPVTEREKRILLSVPFFKDIKKRLLPESGCSKREDALTVMECFATFAGILLCNASDPDSKELLMNACRQLVNPDQKPRLHAFGSKKRNPGK